MSELARQARLWAQKWRWYERNSLPWNRAQIHWQFLRREAFVRWPVHGNVLQALREGRLEIGAGVLLEPNVWITAPERARVRIGAGTFLNQGVMVAAQELVEIGAHCMLANGCFVSDASHRFDDPERPITWQGFKSKGPTRIGENCWLGANVVVTSGVSIGERCVIGANSVVTRDIEPFSIAAGAPARVLGRSGAASAPVRGIGAASAPPETVRTPLRAHELLVVRYGDKACSGLSALQSLALALAPAAALAGLGRRAPPRRPCARGDRHAACAPRTRDVSKGLAAAERYAQASSPRSARAAPRGSAVRTAHSEQLDDEVIGALTIAGLQRRSAARSRALRARGSRPAAGATTGSRGAVKTVRDEAAQALHAGAPERRAATSRRGPPAATRRCPPAPSRSSATTSPVTPEAEEVPLMIQLALALRDTRATSRSCRRVEQLETRARRSRSRGRRIVLAPDPRARTAAVSWARVSRRRRRARVFTLVERRRLTPHAR